MGFAPKGVSKLSELTIDDAPGEAKDIAELILATEGDILYRDEEAAPLAKGDEGQYLKQGEEFPEWGAGPLASVLTTEGDILYRNALVPARLPADFGTGYNFLHMSNTGQLSPEWTDIQGDIIYITGAVNRIIKLATLLIPSPPAISLAVVEGHSGGGHTATPAETIPVPTIVKAADISSVLIDDCEDAWNEYVQDNVTSTADGVTFKKGTASAKMAVVDAAGVGRLATEVVSVDLSSYTYIKAWVRSSVALDAADISILFDEHPECISPLLDLSLPEIEADTWTEVLLVMGDTSGCTAIISIGVDMDVDKGIFDFWIDQVRATKGGI